MTRTPAELDIENLYDFFQIKIREGDHIHSQFCMYPGVESMDLQALANILARTTIYTFNGNHYDIPMLTLALHGAPQAMLKEANDRVIMHGMKSWQFYDFYGITVPDYIDHVDLFDVAPGVAISLKMYAGRLHAPTIQDIPVPFDTPIEPLQRWMVSLYCDNDLEVTGLLRDGLKDRIALRAAMGKQYGVELRSKSDAQIAEAVIKSQLNFNPQRRFIPHGYSFKYEPPHYIRFATPQLQQLLEIARTADFIVSDKEQAIAMGLPEDTLRTGVQIPKQLHGLDIRINQGVYRIGIGGLHSQETSVNYTTQPGVHKLVDVDVKSYYPSLILGMDMYPEQIGPAFSAIYRNIYDRRLEAKLRVSEIQCKLTELKARLQGLKNAQGSVSSAQIAD